MQTPSSTTTRYPSGGPLGVTRAIAIPSQTCPETWERRGSEWDSLAPGTCNEVSGPRPEGSEDNRTQSTGDKVYRRSQGRREHRRLNFLCPLVAWRDDTRWTEPMSTPAQCQGALT